MKLAALALDYDGTLAHAGQIAPHVTEGLLRIKKGGVHLILVSGRKLPDLQRVFPQLDLFDAVVAENGARLFLPAKREDRRLSPPPPPALVQALGRREVEPLDVGESIIATRQPNEGAVLEAIRETGVEWQIVFNKGAVMCLPSGVNKGSGVRAALEELRLSSLDVLAIGDAENDLSLLSACGVRGAVANALDSVKSAADITASSKDGDGVLELFERLREQPLESLNDAAGRYDIVLGKDSHGNAVRLAAGARVFIGGASHSGKSHLTTLLIERMQEVGYQTCVVDPEGDYDALATATVLGTPKAAPELNEIAKFLENNGRGLVVNLVAVEFSARPRYFLSLVELVRRLRDRYARPHWLIADEAHHCIPADAPPPPEPVRGLSGLILVSAEPASIARRLLAECSLVIVVGEGSERMLDTTARALGHDFLNVPRARIARGQALLWNRKSGEVVLFTPDTPASEHQRHIRKYAQGTLGADNSFYFKGPRGSLNLRAQNLTVFLQMAEGVDDETWLHHLRRGDYTRWFRTAIKDEELAAGAEAMEREGANDPEGTRRQIRELINRLYTAPADPKER